MNKNLYNMTMDEVAIERIRTFAPKDEALYVAFSGGKDSIVILDIVKRSGVPYDAHFNLTTVDPPELIHFVRKNYPEVIFEKPEKSMWQLIVEKRMPPTRRVRYCCEVLKEHGGDGRTVVTGVRWAESSNRTKRRSVEAWKHKHILNPIVDWADSDVWQYIKQNKLPYPSLYDEGFSRIGCIGCPMARYDGRINEFIRWPKYKAAYLRAFERCIVERKRLGLTTETRHWGSANSMFSWWIEESKKEIEIECSLF